MTYEAWRISYQSSEEAARAAYAECARLQAKVEAMEQQKPVGTLHDDGRFVWRKTAPHESNYAGWKMALYALPGAKVGEPAPSVPDVDALAQFIREIDGKHQLGAGGTCRAHR